MVRSARLTRVAAALLGAALLALVFMAYLLPEFVVDLGNRLWSCF
jgi:hypothetical protein